MHFPPSLEEVTVSVNNERMWVRNHVEEHGSLFIFSISSKNTRDVWPYSLILSLKRVNMLNLECTFCDI